MTIRDAIHQVKPDGAYLSTSSALERADALRRVRDGLKRDWQCISQANRNDVEQAKESGLSPALLHRLVFDEGKLQDVCRSLDDLVSLPDPVGKVLEKRELDEGLVLSRVSVPLGVIGMVFESRPDALVQIAGLCLKSGNSVILKGGIEALRTNKALTASIKKSLEDTEIGSGWILLLEKREDVGVMLKSEGDIDLIIPRGSNAFVRYVMENTHIPVLGHSSGICHLYIDDPCDVDMAVRLAVDAKTNAPSTCNSIETILVDRSVASSVLPSLAAALRAKGVVIHGDQEVCSMDASCVPFKEGDWDKEYLALEVNIHVVSGIGEAIAHINLHGSHHTDAIVTSDPEHGRLFQRQVDSADVFVNASTRFADGYRYGLGAEVGISTSKIHARGPVGLSGLMTSKWLLDGSGQVVAAYMGPHAKPFTHKELV